MSKKKSDRPIVKSRADLLTEGVRRPSIILKKQCVQLALDRSGSMSGEPIKQAVKAGRDLLKTLGDPSERDAFQVAAISYDDTASTLLSWRQASKARLPDLEEGGQTSFAAAIDLAISNFEKAPRSENDAKPALVFLTDGLGSVDEERISRLHELADVVCVGFGNANLDFLRKLASAPEFVRQTSRASELRVFFTAVAASLSASRASGGLVSGGVDPFASRRL